MKIGVLKEMQPETRVSLIPEHISALLKLQVDVIVENDAGDFAFVNNEGYQQAGATLASREEVLKKSDLILSLHPLSESEMRLLKNKVWIGLFQPLQSPQIISNGQSNHITIFSLDMLPRTTRAQSMDALSSQANIAGYKAVLLAATHFPRYFPMFMTAAGSIPPAKVLILGAGVAGLQAIATARRLGAVVEVFDTRPAVKEEVQSLGAKFVEVEGAADASKAGGYAVAQSETFLQKQKEAIALAVAKSDIVITTAQIPGKKAPLLVDDDMLNRMKKGSVIIDLAASTGGNTSQTQNNQTINYKGIQIIGNSTLPSTVPFDASKMYGKNICNFIALIINKEGTLELNFDDDLVAGACITHEGASVNERIKSLIQS